MAAFHWHPTEENRMLIACTNGVIKDITVHERIPVVSRGQMENIMLWYYKHSSNVTLQHITDQSDFPNHFTCTVLGGETYQTPRVFTWLMSLRQFLIEYICFQKYCIFVLHCFSHLIYYWWCVVWVILIFIW